MKIKSIAAICKKNKNIAIFERNARIAAHILTAAKSAIAERQKPTTTPKKN